MGRGKARDPEATKAAILDSAEDVFLAKGFGETAISDIARHARVTKSLVHHHFGSKQELWQQVKNRRFARYADQQMAMLRGSMPTQELLRESMRAYFYFLQNNPQVVRLLAWMYLENEKDKCFTPGDECERLEGELVDAGIAKIAEGQKLGLLRADVDPGFVLIIFTGLIRQWFQERDHIFAHMKVNIPTEQLDSAFLNDVLKIFFEGVSPRN